MHAVLIFIALRQTAEEKLNAFKTVASFNAQPIEARLFAKKVDDVFQLMRKEAIASGIFYGSSGLTGNLAMLCLLGYGKSVPRNVSIVSSSPLLPMFVGGHLVSRSEISVGDLTSLLIYTG